MTVAVVLNNIEVGDYLFLKSEYYTVDYRRVPAFGEHIAVTNVHSEYVFDLPKDQVVVFSYDALTRLKQNGLITTNMIGCTHCWPRRVGKFDDGKNSGLSPN